MDSKKSIKHKLFLLLITVGAVPFIIVIIAGAISMIGDLEESVQKNGLLRNSIISEHVTDLIEDNFYVLHTLALNPTIIQYVAAPNDENYKAVYTLISEANELFKDSNHMALTSASADQLIRTDGSTLVNINKRQHFKEAMQGNDFVSDIILSMSTGYKIVVLVVPIKDKNDRPIGILQRNFDLTALQYFVEAHDDDEVSVIILDREGRAVANSEEVQTFSTEHMGDINYKFMLDKMSGGSGILRLNIDGKDSLASYSRNVLTSWTIVTIQPYQYILDQVYEKIIHAAMIGLLMLFIVGAIAELLSDRVTKPIIEVANAADEIVKGTASIEKLEVASNDEVGQMAAAFNKIRSARDAYQLESELDKLTKLYNKTTMERLCKMKLKAYNEKEFNDTLMALYVIDLDHFKEVNDTFGHQFGDKVLIEFAKRLRKNFRPNDCIGRFGGDEFVVIIDDLPNIDIIIRKAEQIKHAASTLTIDGGITGITASIGISIVPQHGRDYETLFKTADEALYYVKEHGRDNYRCADFDINAQI